MLLTSVATFLSLLGLSSAIPTSDLAPSRDIQPRADPITTHELIPTTLFEFPNPTWLENFSIRPNGQLVITLITEPTVYVYDPITRAPPVKLFSIPGYISLLGITQANPDVFYFVAGNETNAITTPGSYSLFKFHLGASLDNIVPEKIIDIPEGSFLNGIEVLSNDHNGLVLLVADSGLGLVWKVDVEEKKYEVFIDAPEMKIAADTNVPLGVNGIHLRNSYLYFTSISQKLYVRIPVKKSGKGYKIGATELLATDIFGDDFTLDAHGNAWITEDPKVTLVIGHGKNKGTVVTVAGATGSALAAGGTRCAFGRTEKDKHILYVVTNGGLVTAPDTGVSGGKILAIDTTGYLASLGL